MHFAPHVHSDWSYDGRWPLGKLAGLFRRVGYDGVLMAEHDRTFDEDRWAAYREQCTRHSSERFVLVPGIEYSDPDNVVHIVVWGSEHFLGAGLDTAELLRRVDDANACAMLAHPGRRSAAQLLQHTDLRNLLGIELWNRKYDRFEPNGVAPGLLAHNSGVMPCVGLDFHTARQLFPLSLAITVEAPLVPAAVFEALRARRWQPYAFGRPVAEVANSRLAKMLGAAQQARAAASQGRRALAAPRFRSR
jgi:hypothetical protein